MTKLFLYGLGFCCLSIIGLLILDAHIARRRLRLWAENWKPSGAVNPSGGSVVLPGRFRFFKPAVLVAMAATILLVVAFKRQSTPQHPRVLEPHEPALKQGGEAGNLAASAGDFPAVVADEHPWSFMAVFSAGSVRSDDLQVETVWNTSEWLGICEWLPGSETVAASEKDFGPSLDLGLGTDFSAGENNSYAVVLSSESGDLEREFSYNTTLTEEGNMLLNCSLNGVFALASGPLKTGLLIP